MRESETERPLEVFSHEGEDDDKTCVTETRRGHVDSCKLVVRNGVHLGFYNGAQFRGQTTVC